MDNGMERERRWKIATVRGEGGRKVYIYAYGRTLEEARKRAGSAGARVEISAVECAEEDVAGEA
jgi:phosphoribosylamine-glycine ligase